MKSGFRIWWLSWKGAREPTERKAELELAQWQSSFAGGASCPATPPPTASAPRRQPGKNSTPEYNATSKDGIADSE
jgi:hypothetical protein